jgi:hypothetical protein
MNLVNLALIKTDINLQYSSKQKIGKVINLSH